MKYASILLTSLALVACGGGGGTPTASAPVASVDTFQLKTAFVNYVSDSRSLPFTIAGTSSGVSVTGNGTVTQSTLTNSTFEGLPVKQKVTTITGSLSGQGVQAPLATTGTTFIDSNYMLKGASSSSDYSFVTTGGVIPTTAKVNDTGFWYRANRYTTSAKTTLLGTSDVSFVLEPETASTALLKLIQTDKSTTGSVTLTSVLSFRITPAGGLTRLSESGLDSTTSLTITYAGSAETPTSPSAQTPTTLSADHAVFESLYLNPSASYRPRWSLPSASGAPVSGTHYFDANSATINASPLTSGSQMISTGQKFSIASTLAIPATTTETRYLVGGRIYTDKNWTQRISYQNSSVKSEVLSTDGTVLNISLRSGFQSVQLTGNVVSSPTDFAHSFNALFTTPGLLSSTAIWGEGSAYIQYTSTEVADVYRVFDDSTITTGIAPSPVATGTTISALMASGGIASSSDGVTYTLTNGFLSIVNGVKTYAAYSVRRNQTTNLYRTFYELNGNVYTGDLTRAGTILGGNSYRVIATGTVDYSSKYQIAINKAAVDSLKAAVTF